MFREYLALAARSLTSQRVRSALTLASIGVGTCCIVVMSSLAESGLATIKAGIEDLGGARLLSVFSRPPEKRAMKTASYWRGLTLGDREHLIAALPRVEDKAMWSALGRREFTNAGGTALRADLVAADPRVFSLFHMHVEAGTAFSGSDERDHSRVCVVGHELAARLFKLSPVGRWLSSNGLRCRVVGVLADQDREGVNFGFDWRLLVVAPFSTLVDAAEAPYSRAVLTFRTESAAFNGGITRVATMILRRRHHGLDDFEVFDFNRYIARFDRVFLVMKSIVAIVSGISLLVGGVGVMNMMLVSVSERVSEIGTRRALGASARNIAAQFLCESALLATIGGICGIVLGLLLAFESGPFIRTHYAAWRTVVSPSFVAVAAAVSVAVGLIFGSVPAARAARLNVVEALRSR